MGLTTNSPSLITTLTVGDAIANGGTTPAAAGVVMTIATSTGGVVTYQGDRYRSVGNAGVARFDEPLSSYGVVTVEDLWNIPSWPTGSANRLYEFRHASNFACRVEQNTNGTLVVFNSANTAIWTSTAVATGEVRLSITLDPDASVAGNGDLAIRIYTTSPRTSTTPDQTWSTTAADFTVNALTSVRRSRVSSTASSAATAEPIYMQTVDSTTPIGTYAVGVTVVAVAATASALAEPPAVTAEVVIASGGPATATAAAVAPAVSGGATVLAVRATATALASPPAVSAVVASTVTAVRATATAAAVAPVVTGGAAVTAAGATAIAAAGTPTVSVGATIIAVRATATAMASPPAVGVGTTVVAVKAGATAVAYAPAASTGAVVTAIVATASAGAWAPVVEARVGDLPAVPAARSLRITVPSRTLRILEAP